MKRSSLEKLVTKDDKLPITKVDAAIRQLETAIVLWFHDHDPVSIATLAHASYQIIYDLNSVRSGPPMSLDSERIRPEYRSEWARLMKATPSFFKHADKDPNDVHYFAPKVTAYFVLEAIDVYNSWKLGSRPLFRMFVLWLMLEEPSIFSDSVKAELDQLPEARELLRSEGKRRFFHRMLPQFSEIPKP